jgi:hypothetical protein
MLEFMLRGAVVETADICNFARRRVLTLRRRLLSLSSFGAAQSSASFLGRVDENDPEQSSVECRQAWSDRRVRALPSLMDGLPGAFLTTGPP